MGRIDNSIAWGAPLGTKKQRSEVVDDYRYILRKYGDSFKRPYGWASRFLGGNKNPKFVDLERAIKGGQIVPPYKESSFQVHGGRAGLLGLGSLDGWTVTTTGSNAGLEIPVMHSSLAVMQVTTTTMFYSPARDVVVMRVLMLLDERIHREPRRAAKQLERDQETWEARESARPADAGRLDHYRGRRIEIDGRQFGGPREYFGWRRPARE